MRLLSLRPTMTIKLPASIGTLLAITVVVGGVAIPKLGNAKEAGRAAGHIAKLIEEIQGETQRARLAATPSARA
jgi:hypothetical protein